LTCFKKSLLLSLQLLLPMLPPSLLLLLLLQLKYSVLYWRPISAFRSGFSGFEAVADWEPLL
jgi:hypothetical protein